MSWKGAIFLLGMCLLVMFWAKGRSQARREVLEGFTELICKHSLVDSFKKKAEAIDTAVSAVTNPGIDGATQIKVSKESRMKGVVSQIANQAQLFRKGVQKLGTTSESATQELVDKALSNAQDTCPEIVVDPEEMRKELFKFLSLYMKHFGN